MPEDHLLRESAAVRATPGLGGAGVSPDRARFRALSYAQQRLWFLSRLAGISEAYHMPLAVELAGPLDQAALARALDALVARHEALRTRFVSVAGEPVGVIDQPDRGFALAMDDLSGEADQGAGLAGLQAQEAAAPFDLSAGPLARGRLVRLAPDRHALLLTLHHIVCDGWSVSVLTRELGTLYAAFAADQPDPLPPLPAQYSDYAAWQRRWLASGVAARQGEFWKQALADAPALLELAADRARPAEQDYHGDVIRVEIGPELTARLRALAHNHGVTLFMTLLAAWAIVLSRLSGSQDVVVATPVAGRRRAELSGLVGFFVNTLAMRVDLSGEPAVDDLLRRVRDMTLAALDHQDIPFEQVVELVNPARSLAYTPLAQVMFAWENDEEGHLELPGLTVTTIRTPYTPALFDLTLELVQVGARIIGKLGYATVLFDQGTAQRHLGYLHRVLDQMAADPSRPAGAIVLAGQAERASLLAASDGGAVGSGGSWEFPLLHRLFEAQVARDPAAIAIVDEAAGVTLTYGGLNEDANRLARHLRARGAGPDRLVALCAERSAELIVGLLAVLKAGAAYVPLDPAYPAGRLAAMLGDSAPVAVLTHGPARAALAAALAASTVPPPVIDLDADAPSWAAEPVDDLPADGLAPEHLAYVIYTSGSTGKPNGVLVEHRNLSAVAAAWKRLFGLGPDLTHLQMASPSFDVCTGNVVRALGFGGRLVLCPREMLADEAGLLALIGRHGVNFAEFVPAVLGPLTDHVESVGGSLAGFRTLICGSDEWSAASARRLRAVAGPGAAILNTYGVTEAAVDSAYYLLPAVGPQAGTRLPIGRPLLGVRLYLLDRAGEPVPDGVAGEICIGGACVARGYLNRPELTARRFADSPFVTGDRLYRTGDLGRRRPDGNVEFLGRRDFQVKVRGLRVELGEVEAALTDCQGVSAAVVTGWSGHGQVRPGQPGAGAAERLVGYYLAGPGPAPDAAALRDQLAATLPAHMVPAALVRLDAWPLTPNGKLDRAALPAPDTVLTRGGDPPEPPAGAGSPASAEPEGPMEVALAPLWAQVLGVDSVGRHDDFFALGGHSLSAMRLVGKVRQVLGREASPAMVFAAPSLASFAARLADAGGQALPPIEPASRPGLLPASFAQQRLWFLAQVEGASDAYHMPSAWELTGPLDVAALHGAWDAVMSRHEALRTHLVSVDGRACQQVDPAGPPLLAEDLSGRPDADARLAELRETAATEPFDLARGPLIRGRLVRLSGDRHALLVTMHHIASDGWSQNVLARELSALYAALAAGRPSPLPPLPVQYADYAAWQQAWLADCAARQGAYWVRTLDGAPAELALPADRPRPAEPDYAGGRVRFTLDAELARALHALGKQHGCTVFMALLTAWSLVLSRLSGADDVVVGTPTAGRRRDELAGLIGFFVNTLALRVDLSGMPTVGQLLRRVRDVTLAALDHQDIPFEQVVELANPARSLARTPLFQSMLTWQDDADDELSLPGVTVVPLSAHYTPAKFDLTLSLARAGRAGRAGDEILGALDYATALFDASTACRYVRYLRRVLALMVADPDQPAGALELTDKQERRELLEWGTAGQARLPRALGELFDAAVARAPDAVAVSFERHWMTYRELGARAARLAHHLRALRIGPDSRVAICLRRSPEMIVGLVAILKAGGAYVPLDPAYPAERLAFMLADSAPALLMTQADLLASLPSGLPGSHGTPVLCLDADEAAWADAPDAFPPVARHPDHLAYVIYTSGSTGQPKGVAQTWRCADNLIDWMRHDAAPQSPSPRRVLQFASTSFDVSFQEIWSTLCAGATLVLMATERRGELSELAGFLAAQGVQRAFLPVAVLAQAAALAVPARGGTALPGDAVVRGDPRPQWPRTPDGPEPPAALPPPGQGCEIVTAGEALAITDDIRALVTALGGARLYNHYGPTETHVATSHALGVADAAAWPALPPIGRPLTGARIYLLDGELALVPAGVIGEVHIGGDPLARGYLGRPALTSDRFVPDPFAGPGARMYRTGDLARFRPDGTIDYVGRADGQVKIRGFRVEPGEVEAVLRQVEGVREAAVLVGGDTPADRHLIAYLAGDASIEQARERASLALPGHLVPTLWVRLPALPLTPNGKIDKRALPAPDQAGAGRPFRSPRTPQEAAMAAIWAEILRRERVGIDDDFFALGGHSLLATRLVHAINQRMSARLSLRDLFLAPVLADLAARLASGGEDDGAAYVFPPLASDPAGRHEPFPLTDMQEAYWVGREESIELGGVGAHGYGELRLTELDAERFARAVDAVVARHDMLRAVFDADGTQRVLPAVPQYQMPRQDLRGLDRDSAHDRLAAIRERMSHQVFDASRWPLFEFALTLLDGEVRLHLSLDALIVDVASSQLLEHELAALYADPDAALPPLAVTFRDYVLAERALRGGARYERALRYWRERVADLAPAPSLPLVRAPETVRRPRFTRYDKLWPAEQWGALKAASTARGVTPSAALLTAFAEVLGQWSKSPRFTLSLPLFNRLPLHQGINAVIGDFTSLILVETDVSGSVPFVVRARDVQERLWRDIDHAAVSGVRVNRELASARGTAHAAMPIVFNSTLSELTPGAEDGGLAAALHGQPAHGITQTPQVWIDHTVQESAGRLYYNWDSLDELFPAGMVAQMFAAYGGLLDRLADPAAWEEAADDLLPAPGGGIRAIGGSGVPPGQQSVPPYWHCAPATAPLADGARAAWPAGSLMLHELFDRQALLAPDAPAVISPGRSISYGQLRREARRLAGHLQDGGLAAGDLVAVLADRGWEQVVATLAVLYAGGAYVPLDPAWPAGRIAHVLDRTGAKVALVQPGQLGAQCWPGGTLCPNPPIQLPEHVRAVVVRQDGWADWPEPKPTSWAAADLAYVIYTSGSTGTPKGVMIDHQGAVNTIGDIIERMAIGSDDRVLALSSLSFDLSVFDIFGTLAAGAAVVTLDPGLARDPAHWLDLTLAHRVSVWNSVPALLGMLVEYCEPKRRPEANGASTARAQGGQRLPESLRLAMLSGDWIPVALPGQVRRLLPGLALHSLGGATEASIWSIHYPIGEVDPTWRSIPYGTPMRGQSFHVLDDTMRPRPTWVTGQLWIGGTGLAQGYWRDEATTTARFVTHPVTGERLYRTGDLGRWLPDGTIEFLGREDGQVKVHGYRVELGEIEAALERHPAVRAAAVRLLGTAEGSKRLAAYVVPAGAGADEDELAAHLSATLPSYMVPASYTVLDVLPLSANGKVDRAALPEPATSPWSSEPVPGLAGPDEERLVAAVSRILGSERIAPDANLLRLGATSIDIVRIANALNAELGFRPKLAQLMRQPTVTDLLRMYRAHLGELQGTAAQASGAAPADTAAQASGTAPADTAAQASGAAPADTAAQASGAAPADTVQVPAGPALAELHDPQARAEFKARGSGRRGFGPGVAAVALSAPDGPAAARRYADYRSVRDFAQVPVDARDLGALLASLAAREVDGTPKYLYGSAGGAYPVQAYLYIKPGRVAGVPGGAHYYDPRLHRLVSLGRDQVLDPDAFDYFINKPVFEAAAFALFLVAEMAAIEPLYGPASAGFCQLEAGAMAQLLTMVAVEHGIGLCGIGSVDLAAVASLCDLGPTHRLVYSMVGGVRPPEPGLAVGAAPGVSGRSAGNGRHDEIRPRPAGAGPLPLSCSQRQLWFLDQLAPGNPFYNNPAALRLHGPLDVGALESALAQVVRRHEALRTVFESVDGEPSQVVRPPGPVPLPVTDLSALTAGQRAEGARQAARADARAPFDLAAGPLLRASLLRLAPDEHHLLLNVHHIVADGWSIGIAISELAACYAACVSGEPPALPPLPVQYADYALWQRDRLRGGELERQLAYWTGRLAGAPTLLALPADRPRPAVQSFAGGYHAVTAPPEVVAGLREVAQEAGATLFMALVAALSVLLWRLSGTDDVCVGTPFAGRDHAEVEGLVGHFVNTVVIRSQVDPRRGFDAALDQVRGHVLDAHAHPDLPFDQLVEALRPERHTSHSPLFQVMLVMQNMPGGALELPGLTVAPLPTSTQAARFDLAVEATGQGNQLSLNLEYAADLFDAATIARLAGQFTRLLAQVAASPSRPAGELDLLGQAERDRLVHEWNATAAPPAGPASLVERFEAMARERPKQLAVAGGGQALDYATLDRQASRLAWALLARGVGPDQVVGLHAARTPTLVVGMLGILKAGAAYLPLDPVSPPERLAAMVADTRPVLVLSDAGPPPDGWESLATVQARGERDDPPAVSVHPASLAYVICTSGSTGRPKGVAVAHGSVANLLDHWIARMGTVPGEPAMLWSSAGFDVSIQEIFLPLTTGGTLHLVPEELRADPEALTGWMRASRIAHAYLPPAFVRWIDEDPAQRLGGLALRQLLVGVEPLSELGLHRAEQALPGLRVLNGYGPTEATNYCTCYTGPGPVARTCPIGKPLANTRIYLLDERGEPVPVGVAGEIHVGGAGLARGYLGQPGLTAERFVPDPNMPGMRMYRTGDLARYLPDGNIEFLGRLDDQVKLRGFRIEPGEVEAALWELPDVSDAAVVLDREDDGEQRLVAAVSRGEAEPRLTSEWRELLSPRLPGYMIPALFVELPRLPRTATGKLDRAALLASARAQARLRVNQASPRDQIELTLYQIWKRLLLHPDIGISDSFFDIGGTSISAIKLAHAIGEEFGQALPVLDIMLYPTIEALGGRLRHGSSGQPPSNLIEFRAGTSAGRVLCVHPAGGTAFCYLALAKVLPESCGVYGIQSPGVNPGEEFLPTVEAMAQSYLRLTEHLHDGPVLLTGLSYGGLVAYEMGRRLALAGHREVSVILLDTLGTDDPAARAAIAPVDLAEFRDKLVKFNGMYPGIDDRQIEQYYRIYNHNRLTMRDYLAPPGPTRLVLLQATAARDEAFLCEVREFWARRTPGELALEFTDRDHWELLESDEVWRVAGMLRGELDRIARLRPTPSGGLRAIEGSGPSGSGPPDESVPSQQSVPSGQHGGRGP